MNSLKLKSGKNLKEKMTSISDSDVDVDADQYVLGSLLQLSAER